MSEQTFHGELDYSDVLLVPKYSFLGSRKEADTTFKLGKWKFSLPIVPSNMETVINLNLCQQLDRDNYFYIMHRFQDMFETVRKLNDYRCKCVSVSIGVNEESYQYLQSIIDNNYKIDIITIDVAHGHHVKVTAMIKYIKKYFEKDIIIIAGNVGTAEGFKQLQDSGADVVKVGIGSGVICTTRFKTGFGTPMFSTLLKIAPHKKSAKIMADGGCKHFGDIAKALVAGADCVMSGSFFAPCADSPAKVVRGAKEYYGSTSYKQKGDRLHFVEGKQVDLELAPEYEVRLQEIQQALRSSISYAGGKDLSCFSDVKFIQLK
jgi:GMP reductase